MKGIYFKKWLRKCLCSLLVVHLIFGNVESVSFAETATVGDVTYEFFIDDDDVIIYDATSDTDVVELKVPSSLNNVNITKIMGHRNKSESFGAFQNLHGLERVVVSEGITEIGTNAFRNCTSLKSVVLPDSLKLIDICSFMNCMSLVSISLPEYVGRVRYNAFANCTNLEKINICVDTSVDEGSIPDTVEVFRYRG